jgi:chromosome segregation ATPase
MPMTKGQLSHHVFCAAALGTSNAVAWLSDLNVGAIATGATIFGGLVIGLYARAIRERAQARADALRLVEQAKADAWAAQQRLEMQVQADRDRLDAGSLTAQLKRLQQTIDETKARADDANQKLHDMRGEANRDALRHHEEVDRLMRQNDSLMKQNDELGAELHAARDEIRGLREQVARPLARIAINQEQQDRRIEANARKIDDVASKSGVFPAASEPNPTDQG